MDDTNDDNNDPTIKKLTDNIQEDVMNKSSSETLLNIDEFENQQVSLENKDKEMEENHVLKLTIINLEIKRLKKKMSKKNFKFGFHTNFLVLQYANLIRERDEILKKELATNATTNENTTSERKELGKITNTSSQSSNLKNETPFKSVIVTHEELVKRWDKIKQEKLSKKAAAKENTTSERKELEDITNISSQH
ncbi:uncharacterized protein KGF55_000345 [Candida pseudojiufengensis]|uniref:uncharacterized protein n=1 Tax=Candida pseudojiufengensis TaxID=497109 RepID=UPI0022257D73|nr:uncharacterized protein KGF55_000345 [Candida pseudojiufengensis]KAI5966936.1 hypothetical protein KGF55_000345 [Candida pseudojiufengensis]